MLTSLTWKLTFRSGYRMAADHPQVISPKTTFCLPLNFTSAKGSFKNTQKKTLSWCYSANVTRYQPVVMNEEEGKSSSSGFTALTVCRCTIAPCWTTL